MKSKKRREMPEFETIQVAIEGNAEESIRYLFRMYFLRNCFIFKVDKMRNISSMGWNRVFVF